MPIKQARILSDFCYVTVKYATTEVKKRIRACLSLVAGWIWSRAVVRFFLRQRFLTILYHSTPFGHA